MVGKLKVQKNEGTNQGPRCEKMIKDKAEKYVLSRDSRTMNGDKEVTVEAGLWTVFEQGRCDIEQLNVSFCIENKAIYGLEGLRGRIEDYKEWKRFANPLGV